MFKRSVDLTFSFTLLLLSAPVVVVAALLIKLESQGPVLFRQTRMGRGLKPFVLYKLRTMSHGTKGLHYTIGGDPRVTRIGELLRRTKIDELPQLLNVIRGDMSLVGPRPVVPQIALDFREAYEYLLRFRPGLTDPASLKYCRESELLALAPDPVAYFNTVVTPDKLRLSVAYVERATLGSDLVILAQTALAVTVGWHPASEQVSKRSGSAQPRITQLHLSRWAEREAAAGD